MDNERPQAPVFSIEERYNRFVASIKSAQPVVFCVTCGSTKVDQNFLYTIQCYDCGTVSDWNGKMFSLARDGAPDDALEILRGPRGKSDRWIGRLNEGIHGFAIMLTSVTPIASASGEDLSAEDLDRLREEWETRKAVIDRILAELKVYQAP